MILRRPMFRRGGSAGEGITSGLAPRQGYANQSFVEQIRPTKEEYQSIAGMLPARSRDTSMNDFLINFGLNMASASPTGNVLQTAAMQAKDPFARFQQQKAARAGSGREESMDILKTIMTAKAEALGSEGGSQRFAKQANDQEIQSLMGQLFELDAGQRDEKTKLSDDDYHRKQSILMQRLQGYTGKNPAVQSLFGNKEQADLVIGGIQQDILGSEETIEVMGPDGEMIEVIEGEYASENPKYLGEETSKRYIQQYNAMVKQSLGLAKGGRAGYANAGAVMPGATQAKSTGGYDTSGLQGYDMEGGFQPSNLQGFPDQAEEGDPQSSDNLSYEELRARLPAEITDDIVVILSESPQALIDFSEIQTQTDVDEFNMKYGVNLVLPSGA